MKNMDEEKTNIKSSCMGFNPTYSEEAPSFEQVSQLAGSTIIEFGAPWCGHCIAATSAIQETLSKHRDVTHIKLFDGKGKILGRKFKVKLWPTLILLNNGLEVGRLIRPLQAGEVNQLLENPQQKYD